MRTFFSLTGYGLQISHRPSSHRRSKSANQFYQNIHVHFPTCHLLSYLTLVKPYNSTSLNSRYNQMCYSRISIWNFLSSLFIKMVSVGKGHHDSGCAYIFTKVEIVNLLTVCLFCYDNVCAAQFHEA